MTGIEKEERLPGYLQEAATNVALWQSGTGQSIEAGAVSYTHLRAHETVLDLVCRLLLEKKNTPPPHHTPTHLPTHMGR